MPSQRGDIRYSALSLRGDLLFSQQTLSRRLFRTELERRPSVTNHGGVPP